MELATSGECLQKEQLIQAPCTYHPSDDLSLRFLQGCDVPCHDGNVGPLGSAPGALSSHDHIRAGVQLWGFLCAATHRLHLPDFGLAGRLLYMWWARRQMIKQIMRCSEDNSCVQPPAHWWDTLEHWKGSSLSRRGRGLSLGRLLVYLGLRWPPNASQNQRRGEKLHH